MKATSGGGKVGASGAEIEVKIGFVRGKAEFQNGGSFAQKSSFMLSHDGRKGTRK